MKSIVLFFTFCLAVSLSAFGQGEAPENWYNLDNGTDKVQGVSTEKTYAKLLKGRDSETVIVAVIDSGVDAEHEDLKEVMWVNEDEIPGNGIDDDRNGYIDDIHGWNFIGGKNGKNVSNDALEITRLVAHYDKKFKGKDSNSLSKKEKKEYETYQELKGLLLEQNLNESYPIEILDQPRGKSGRSQKTVALPHGFLDSRDLKNPIDLAAESDISGG